MKITYRIEVEGIGLKLALALKQKRITQKELADRIGVSKSWVSKFCSETIPHGLSVEKIQKIEQELETVLLPRIKLEDEDGLDRLI
jgi:transcriptional regulator with XRE-family HTH domain